MQKSLSIIKQGKEGYRFSIEPFFLADYVQTEPNMRILDIGTGCGIIPLLLAVREPLLDITAVEIQKSLYCNAIQNVATNGMNQTIKICHGDFLALAETLNHFDIIISNPPFRKINSGRLNPNTVKAIARHELTLTLSKLIHKSTPLLKRGSKLILAYHPDRLEEILDELHNHKVYPHRLRWIHGYKQAKAKIILIEALKEKPTQLTTEDPFYIYYDDGSYTQEMKKIYASFNYPCRSHRLKEKRNSTCAG